MTERALGSNSSPNPADEEIEDSTVETETTDPWTPEAGTQASQKGQSTAA